LQERYYIQQNHNRTQERPSEASKSTKSLGRRGSAWGKIPGKGTGKGRGGEKGRVMEGRGGRGRIRIERMGRKGGDLLYEFRG